jgi:uncharacterized protein (TIGR01777 family)
MTMRVIITGGTGLMGQALTANLINDGHEVIVLSRSPQNVIGLPASVRVEKWDAKTAEGWSALADGADAIVNLAGASIAGDGLLPSRWTDSRKKLILESRVNAGRAVVDAVKNAARKPGVVIQSSAVGYYGISVDEDTTEDAPPADDFLARVCVAWESATQPVEAMGVRRVVIRSGLVLSRRGGALPRMALPFQLFVGGPMGTGRQPLSWIHMADEIAAIRFLIDHPQASGVFNLVAPQPVTNAEFSRALGRALSRPAWIPLPGFALKLAFGELATTLLEGQRVIPRRLLDIGFTFQHPEADSALRRLYRR